MANNWESLGQQYTARSISLPSRLHHPLAIRIEAELNKLKQWEASSLSITEPLSGEAIQAGLIGLAELYNCTQELMLSSSTQQALLQHQNGIIVEESLDRSVELLDSCGAIRDLFLTIKENVQELQSALRRKIGDSSIESDITTYLCSRKKLKKEIARSLRTLKRMECRIEPSLVLDIDHNLAMVIRVLREVTAITISILKSLLVFLSLPASSRTKSGGWSLIAKLMITKSAASHKPHSTLNNVGCVDIALKSLHRRIKNGENKVEVQMVGRQLQMLDSSIEALEAGLECLFRQLVQNRVTLLNILTH